MRLLTVCLLVSLVALPAEALVLRHRWVKGEVRQYTQAVDYTVGQGTGQPKTSSLAWSGWWTLRVLDTPAAGQGTVETTVLEKAAEGEGTPTQLSSEQATYDARGKAVKAASSEGSILEDGDLPILQAEQFPEKDVKPGESWQYTVMGMPAVAKLLAVETKAGRSCAKIEVTATLPVGSRPGTSGSVKLLYWFDPELGCHVALESSANFRMEQRQPNAAPSAPKLVTTMRLNAKQTLLPPAPKTQ